MIAVKTLMSGKCLMNNVAVEVLETEGDKVLVYSGTFKDGEEMTPGLEDANAMWDEKKKRPKGYLMYCSFQSPNGWRRFVMVAKEFYEANKGGMKGYVNQWGRGWQEVR